MFYEVPAILTPSDFPWFTVNPLIKGSLLGSLLRLLFGGTLGRSGSLFSGGKGLYPLVLSKAPFPLPQVHTTFVISHNVCELNPIPERRPVAIATGATGDAVNFD